MKKMPPRHGIRIAFRNAVVVGSATGLTMGLLIGLMQSLSNNLTAGVVWGVAAALFFGLLGGLFTGGLDLIQHYVLRLFLILQRRIPFRYIRFLDNAVDLIFLRRVGGGYQFRHNFFRKRFAALDDTFRRK